MDPQLSGVAIGLLFGAAKVGLIATAGFAIAWWRGRRRVAALEAAQSDPDLIEERLAALERTADYTATQLERLLEGQATLLRQLPAPQPRATTDAATPTRSAP